MPIANQYEVIETILNNAQERPIINMFWGVKDVILAHGSQMKNESKKM